MGRLSRAVVDARQAQRDRESGEAAQQADRNWSPPRYNLPTFSRPQRPAQLQGNPWQLQQNIMQPLNQIPPQMPPAVPQYMQPAIPGRSGGQMYAGGTPNYNERTGQRVQKPGMRGGQRLPTGGGVGAMMNPMLPRSQQNPALGGGLGAAVGKAAGSSQDAIFRAMLQQGHPAALAALSQQLNQRGRVGGLMG